MIQAKIIRKEQMVASRWSGGTTTQIDLYPQEASYAERNFDFRVSSATIEESPSRFTALPDYQRWIAMLSGPVVLEHVREQGPGQDLEQSLAADVTQDAEPNWAKAERIQLAPLQVHYFDGGVPTKSIGEARDFNLMLRKGHYGKMVKVSSEDMEGMLESWIRVWLADRNPDAFGHLAVYWPESDAGHAQAQEAVVTVADNGLIQLNHGDYVRYSGEVKALADVRLILPANTRALVLYMET